MFRLRDRPFVMRHLSIFVLSLLMAACSGGGGGSCDVAGQNRTLHNKMLGDYYWYQRVPTDVNYNAYSSPGALLNYLRYDTLDRFSYITSQSAFDNLFNNGTYVGYGFGYNVDSGGKAGILFVYNQSPAGLAGMERGDEILQVNGQSVASIIAADSWNDIFSAGDSGTLLTLELRRKSSGLVETVQIAKGVVTINTVLHSEVIASGPKTIGYLVFSSFLNTSLAELDPVFTQFNAAGVDELILDLRYNGGGSISVARDLASYIKSTLSSNNDLYVQLRHNDKRQSNNFNYNFKPESNSLNLTDLTVITTDLTCSASEQVISALRPFLNQVTVVGGTTCGKPVGQSADNFCDSTLLAVNFGSFNANGEGDYFSGIAADCSAVDDFDVSFGDVTEPMLSAAKFFVDNQTCQVVTKAPLGSSIQLRGLQGIAGAV
ncbi:MAG: S41 family peptidase [Pseudomonadota bacterium]